MPKKTYIVNLTEADRQQLLDLVSKGTVAARQLNRAHILLHAHDGAPDAALAKGLRVGQATVGRIRRRFVEGTLEHALNENPRPGAKRKLDDKQEAFLITTACSTPPARRKEWTMQLLANRMVEIKQVDALSDETVRRAQKNKLKPWLKEKWCIPVVAAEYVWHMEDVLDVYPEPEDPKRPRVCVTSVPIN